jgi:hypothetical protein
MRQWPPDEEFATQRLALTQCTIMFKMELTYQSMISKGEHA